MAPYEKNRLWPFQESIPLSWRIVFDKKQLKRNRALKQAYVHVLMSELGMESRRSVI